MTTKEIYEEIMSNIDINELFDERDEDGDRITVLNKNGIVIVSVESGAERGVYAGSAIINSEEFKEFTCDEFTELVKERPFVNLINLEEYKELFKPGYMVEDTPEAREEWENISNFAEMEMFLLEYVDDYTKPYLHRSHK